LLLYLPWRETKIGASECSLLKKKADESLQRLKRVVLGENRYLLDLFGCLELLLSLMIKLCIGRSAWNIFTVQVCVMTHFALFESNISLPDAACSIYRCLYCWQTSKNNDRLTLTQKKTSWKKKRRVSLFNDWKGSCQVKSTTCWTCLVAWSFFYHWWSNYASVGLLEIFLQCKFVWWRISLYLSQIYHFQVHHGLYIDVSTVGRLPKPMIDWP
jgi:hypothetical protein